MSCFHWIFPSLILQTFLIRKLLKIRFRLSICIKRTEWNSHSNQFVFDSNKKFISIQFYRGRCGNFGFFMANDRESNFFQISQSFINFLVIFLFHSFFPNSRISQQHFFMLNKHFHIPNELKESRVYKKDRNIENDKIPIQDSDPDDIDINKEEISFQYLNIKCIVKHSQIFFI